MRRRTKRYGLIKWFMLIGTTLVVISDGAAQTYVKIGIISPTFGHAPFYVARDKGFFRNEGFGRRGHRHESRRSHLAIAGRGFDSVW
jgi:ABC-type nitrate/sulfonate/bicarbonate transport system substrate-binding protein